MASSDAAGVTQTAPTQSFNYQSPLITSIRAVLFNATINGNSFGANPALITLTVNGQPCDNVVIVTAHRQLSCTLRSVLLAGNNNATAIVNGRSLAVSRNFIEIFFSEPFYDFSRKSLSL